MNNIKINKSEKDSEFRQGIDLKYLIYLIKINKINFLITSVAFGAIGILVSFMLPNVYRAQAKILPPQQNQSSASSLLNQLNGIGAGAISIGGKTTSDLYISMLKSRTVTDNLIEVFDLKKHYNLENKESIHTKLEANSNIYSGKDGIITIEVEDTDPKLASDIANKYTEELTALTNKLALTEASQRRLFYEKQVEKTKEKLISAESQITDEINQKGLLSVDAQSKSLIETITKLRINISAKEVQIKSLSSLLTPENPNMKQLSNELISMNSELKKLEGRSNAKQPDEQVNINVRKGDLNNVQELREIKYLQVLYETLLKQYEISRIDEAKDFPMIQVLDYAIEPEIKVKPKRLLIIVGFLLFGILANLARIIFKYTI